MIDFSWPTRLTVLLPTCMAVALVAAFISVNVLVLAPLAVGSYWLICRPDIR